MIMPILQYKWLAQNAQLVGGKSEPRSSCLPTKYPRLCLIHVHQALYSGNDASLPLLPSLLKTALFPLSLKIFLET